MPDESLIRAALQHIPDQPLSSNIEIPPFRRSVVKKPSFRIGAQEVNVVADAEAVFQVAVLNDANDVDSDGVYGKPSAEHDPHISFTDQKAWLKYKFTGGLRGELGAEYGLLGLAVKGNRSVNFAEYRAHDPSETAVRAIVHDLTTARNILDTDRVKRLEPGEAVSLQIEGDLSVKVSFTWADAFTTAANELTKLLGSSQAIAIKLSAGLTAAVSLAVSDDFVMIVSRTTTVPPHYRLTVKKGRSRGLGFSVQAKIGAEFENAGHVQQALTAMLDGVIGAPLAEVNALLTKIESLPGTIETKLNDVEKRLFEMLVARLQVESALDRVKAIREKINSIRDKAVDVIKEIATAKATVAFRYEYSRLDESAILGDVILLADALFDDTYDLALRGEVGELATRAAADPARFQLKKYLNERTITVTRSLGFALNFGRWAIATNDKSELKTVERRDVAGRRMISFLGVRSYTEKGVPNPDFTWSVDLKADMNEFRSEPKTDAMDFGLSMIATFPRVDANDVERLLDFAAMWRVFSSNDQASVEEKIEALGERPKARLQLLFTESALLAALKLATMNDWPRFGTALGAATPYRAELGDRRTFVRRALAYGPVWTAFLAGVSPHASSRDWAATVARRVDPNTAFFEKSNQLGTFVDMIFRDYTKVRQDVIDFANGISRLSNALSSPQDPNVVKKAFAGMQNLWSQRPFIGASGYYLLGLCAEAGVLDMIERTLTVEKGDAVLTVSSRQG